MLFMSSVPIFKKDVLIKLPVVSSPPFSPPCKMLCTDADFEILSVVMVKNQIAPYFEDKTHPADNAF